jgi:cytochrome c-type biogenesis protein CcmH
VVVVALVIGSGVLGSSTPSTAQRAAAIEADLRCPSCEDLSVAQSDAPTAVAVRSAIRHQLAQGRTDAQVEAYLVSRYGSSIELTPPADGWSLLVWLLPLLVGGAGLACVVVVLVRRNGGEEKRGHEREGAEARSPEELAERRAFLERSLADADAEYLAGDLSDRDYLGLRRRDMARLAALERPVPTTPAEGSVAVAERAAPGLDRRPERSSDGEAPSGRDPATRRGKRSWWFLAGAVLAFGAALVVAVTQLSSSRLPGQTPTGSVSLAAPQQVQETLAQAATEEGDGQVTQAASLYHEVLAAHPDNEVALAQLGWIEFEAAHPTGDRALLSDARAKLRRAVQLDPGDDAAHLYLGTLLFEQDASASAAVAQFTQFLDDQPPAALVAQAAPVLRPAYAAAGVPLPPQVPTSG